MGFKRLNEKGKLIRRIKFAVKNVRTDGDGFWVFLVGGNQRPTSLEMTTLIGVLSSAKIGLKPESILVWANDLDIQRMSRAEMTALRDNLNQILAAPVE